MTTNNDVPIGLQFFESWFTSCRCKFLLHHANQAGILSSDSIEELILNSYRPLSNRQITIDFFGLQKLLQRLFVLLKTFGRRAFEYCNRAFS